MGLNNTNRRTVLKGIGAGVVGSASIVGSASAGGSKHGNQTDDHDLTSYAWGDGELWEMLEAEPPAVNELEAGRVDEEGAHESHRPLWVIATVEDPAVEGSEHGPHPNPDGLPIDHVVPLGGGGEFTAQWHVTLVLNLNTGGFENQDGDGNYLLSADTIRSANNIATVPLFDPDTGEPAVFTCPIRPHQHKD